MKRKSFALLFAVLSAMVMMLAGNLVSAQEEPPIIEPMPPRWVPGVWTNPEWLTVDFHRVRATIEDQLATTSIVCSSHNPVMDSRKAPSSSRCRITPPSIA